MSEFGSESFSEGDWEERGDLAWNEYDWQRYLKQNEQDIARFLNLYHKHKTVPNRLDEIAHLLGWDKEDWNTPDEPAPQDDGQALASWYAASEETGEDEMEEPDDLSPYTVHRHPVFIVTRGLYRHLKEGWEFMINNSGATIPTRLSWDFSNSLQGGELNAIMAIQSLDMGDFNLAVCHLKNALAAMNHSLALVNQLPVQGNPMLPAFQADAQLVLFDLRELWLRVMAECRDENRRKD